MARAAFPKAPRCVFLHIYIQRSTSVCLLPETTCIHTYTRTRFHAIPQAYRAEGLNFEHLAIQNEPNQGSPWNGKSCGNSYPKMHWTGAELAEFLKNHLGPTFEREGIADQVGAYQRALSLVYTLTPPLPTPTHARTRTHTTTTTTTISLIFYSLFFWFFYIVLRRRKG